MNDKQLRDDVLAELDFEPSVNSADIGVAVSDGVVTLTGHVPNYAQKIAAEAAARRVRGVKAIAQEIEVRYPSDKKTADDEIAKRALDILRWSEIIPKDALKLTVNDGWVKLTGEVEWQYQRRAAEDEIRKLSGVAGVVNNIVLKPRVLPSDVKQKIEDALKRNAEIEARSVQVCVVDGGIIELDGKVHSWQERLVVENAAWSAPGVSNVRDRLSIG